MIHLLKEHERLVVSTLGKISGVKGPGLVLVMPMLQTAVRMDLRETFTLATPHVTMTWRVVDPAKALEQVADYRQAIEQLAITVMKKILAGREVDALVFERQGVEAQALADMNAAAAAWGLEVQKVEAKRR